MKSPRPRGLIFAIGLSILYAPGILAQAPSPPGAPPLRPAGSPPMPRSTPPSTLPAPPAPVVSPMPAASPAPTAQASPRLPVPPPIPETAQLPRPNPTANVPHLRDLAMAMPEIEIWRPQSLTPQMPTRRHRRFELAYVVGKETALVRLRFHPLAAGQAIVVQPGPGVTVSPPDTEFRVEKNGECVVAVSLDGSFIRSDFNVFCAGVKTKVPLERASLEEVVGKEAAGRIGR